MGLERRPLDGDPTRGITPTLSTVVADVTGRPPHHRSEAFWTDAALLADAGIPAVLFGVDAQAPTHPRNGSTSAPSTTPPGSWNAPSPRGPAWMEPNNDTRDRSEH